MAAPRRASTRSGAAQVLDAPDLEHAVARGAAYYGKARRGHGVRIRSGASRTYYIGIESAMPAVPGMEAPLQGAVRRALRHGRGNRGRRFRRREFGLVVGEPARVSLPEFHRPQAGPRRRSAGNWGNEIEELSPLEVTLNLDGQQGTVLPVRLEIAGDRIGTLEVWCVSRDGAQRWKLELNIRETGDR